MANVPVPTDRDDSKYRIALELMMLVGAAENVKVSHPGGASREWILKTYVECLNATIHNASKIATAAETTAWLKRP